MKTPTESSVAETPAQGQMEGVAAVAGGFGKMTRADIDALARLPKRKWFRIGGLSHMIRNPRWRCDRLAGMGLLKSRVVKDHYKSIPGAFGYAIEWRVLPNVPAQPRDQ